MKDTNVTEKELTLSNAHKKKMIKPPILLEKTPHKRDAALLDRPTTDLLCHGNWHKTRR